MIGGFFLLDCASRTKRWTSPGDCPAAEWATVEVRALGPCFDDSRGDSGFPLGKLCRIRSCFVVLHEAILKGYARRYCMPAARQPAGRRFLTHPENEGEPV